MWKLILNWSQTIDQSKFLLSHKKYLGNFRNEYFLADYIYKVGNYNIEFIKSGFIGEGYTDIYNANYAQAAQLAEAAIRKSFGTTVEPNIVYDFCIIPNVGFLGNNDPLPVNTEVKLSFDRASPSVAILSDADPDVNLVIKDCFAMTEYISSPNLRAYFDGINTSPIKYDFEDCEVYTKSIPQGETNIRFDNLCGGNVPSHMFIGIIETAALNGDYALSSTKFSPHSVSQMNISLNGNSVNGYPVRVQSERPVIPMSKFVDCTNQIQSVDAGATLNSSEFMFNWLWSHCFEAEETSRGWLGIDFKIDEAYDTPMTMVVWIISPTCISIDKFHQIEKINL